MRHESGANASLQRQVLETKISEDKDPRKLIRHTKVRVNCASQGQIEDLSFP
jgi:hypothetical protein